MISACYESYSERNIFKTPEQVSLTEGNRKIIDALSNLPNAWRERHDHRTGKTYFENCVSKRIVRGNRHKHKFVSF